MSGVLHDGWSVAALTLGLACSISFAWAMRRFFTMPTGGNRVISAVYLLASILAPYQLIGVLLAGCNSPTSGLLGLGLYASSLALFWAAVRVNRRKPLSFAFSVDAPSHLVSEGPYRYIRHPFYSAYLLAAIAGPVITLHPALLVPALVMAPIYWLAASREERKFIQSPLSREYERYRATTGMFLPRASAFYPQTNWTQ